MRKLGQCAFVFLWILPVARKGSSWNLGNQVQLPRWQSESDRETQPGPENTKDLGYLATPQVMNLVSSRMKITCCFLAADFTCLWQENSDSSTTVFFSFQLLLATVAAAAENMTHKFVLLVVCCFRGCLFSFLTPGEDANDGMWVLGRPWGWGLVCKRVGIRLLNVTEKRHCKIHKSQEVHSLSTQE